ncbi:Tfp pilus assembly protein FimT/FimU [Candidatus Riflebacteria bacterium]
MQKNSSSFTIFEVLLVITTIFILISAGTLNYQELLGSSQLDLVVDAVKSDIRLAQESSIRKQKSCSFLLTDNNYAVKVVNTGETIVQGQERFKSYSYQFTNVSLPDADKIIFNTLGMPENGGGTFTLTVSGKSAFIAIDSFMGYITSTLQ